MMTSFLIIGCVYRSPSCTYDQCLQVNNVLKIASDFNTSHLLVMGDFNYKERNWATWTTSATDENSPCNRFIEAVRDSFIYQHVNKPTRARGEDTPNILDLIFTNEEGMVTDLEYQSPVGKSDHSVLLFNFNCYMLQSKSKINKYAYDRGDYDGFRRHLNNINWQEVVQDGTSTNEKWISFKNIIEEGINTYIPKIEIKLKANQKKYRTPLDQKLLTKIRKKHRLWQRYMETKEGVKYQEYCRIRNQVRKLTRQAKSIYEKQIADEAKTNPKKFWKYTKSKTKTNTGIPDLERTDDKGNKFNVYDDKDKAATFNSFFSSVFTSEPDGPMPEFNDRNYDSPLDNIEITPDEVEKKLNKLNPSKSTGPDGIHPRILREISNNIAPPLANIFTTSIQTGTLPDDWKLANITAIFKKGAKKDPSNYRPVSLTSVTCKLLETIIRDNIFGHMKRNKLFSKKQFGFITGRSTTLQLLMVLEDWTKAIDQGTGINNIYMDFMKAFDKVPHQRLLHKLKSYGIQGNVWKWVEAFLVGRKQRVMINGTPSEWEDVTSGIPQGTVLGPLLFVLYINDLPDEVSEGTEIYLFADDTKIYRKIDNINDCNILQSDLNKLLQWSNKWLLKFHPNKCKVIKVGPNIHEYAYSLDGNILENLEHEKDIGVTVDKDLKFDVHMQDKISKANRVMGLIRRSFSYINCDVFNKLYKALVRPHLEYANPVWSPSLKKNIIAIENVQRRATKSIASLRDMSYEERLQTLKLPTLVYRRLRGDMIETYKITSGKYDNEIQNIFPMYKDHVKRPGNRGHSKKIFKTRTNLNLRKHFFTNRVIDFWNRLPEAVVSAPSVKSFERRLDKIWKDEEILYNFESIIPTQAITRINVTIDLEKED